MTRYKFQIFISDFVACILGFVLLYLLRFDFFADSSASIKPYALITLLASALWLSLLSTYGTYGKRILSSGTFEYGRVVQASLMYLLIGCSLLYLSHSQISRLFITGSMFSCLLFTLAFRSLLNKRLIRKFESGIGLRSTMLIGDENFRERISNEILENPRLGLEITSGIDYQFVVGSDEWSDTVFDLAKSKQVEVLVVQEKEEVTSTAFGYLSWRCQKAKIELLTAPVYMDVLGPRFTIQPHHALPLLHVDEPVLPWTSTLFKRIVDIAISTVGLVLLSPFFLLISIMIRLTSRGPILFTQPRIGKNGRLFQFPKFRTMYHGADKDRSHVIGLPDSDIVSRYQNDPRITSIGRVLRRFSLDELPQLFSVFLGRMSVVGPRPILEVEMQLVSIQSERRHLLKPGLTGLWQISGRKNTTWDERIQLDLYYINNWSIGLDFSIILKTFKTVLTGEGAY